MNRKTKLLILILLSLSVYFIYKNNIYKEIKITSLGDGLSLGINSYGMEGYGYLDYCKDSFKSNNNKVKINSNYSKKELTISRLLETIKYNPNIKRDLLESHYVILHLGFNDYIYKLAIDKKISKNNIDINISSIKKNYQKLLTEIRKYYKKNIIVLGYYEDEKESKLWNYGIKKLNKILKKEKNISYIDINSLLSNHEKYFLNPNSYYPNQLAYQAIAKQIIIKTLEK